MCVQLASGLYRGYIKASVQCVSTCVLRTLQVKCVCYTCTCMYDCVAMCECVCNVCVCVQCVSVHVCEYG